MSAELVLAVVPICLAAMAGCVQAWDKIKLMCNYHNEVETLRFKFEIQMKHFYQEVRLLLGEMFGRVIADAMIRDQNSKLWIDLESALAAHLGGSIMYEDYIKAMDQVNRCIKTIQKRLDHCFPGEGKVWPPFCGSPWNTGAVGFRINISRGLYQLTCHFIVPAFASAESQGGYLRRIQKRGMRGRNPTVERVEWGAKTYEEECQGNEKRRGKGPLAPYSKEYKDQSDAKRRIFGTINTTC